MPNFIVRLCAMIAAVSMIAGIGRWPNLWFFIDIFMLAVWIHFEWKEHKKRREKTH